MRSREWWEDQEVTTSVSTVSLHCRTAGPRECCYELLQDCKPKRVLLWVTAGLQAQESVAIGRCRTAGLKVWACISVCHVQTTEWQVRLTGHLLLRNEICHVWLSDWLEWAAGLSWQSGHTDIKTLLHCTTLSISIVHLHGDFLPLHSPQLPSTGAPSFQPWQLTGNTSYISYITYYIMMAVLDKLFTIFPS